MGKEEYKAAGSSFMLDRPGTTKIFMPEYFNEEQQEVARLAEEFVKNDIAPVAERIEEKEEGLLEKMVKKSGELGLLSIDVPEKYDGAGMDKVTSMLACLFKYEAVSDLASDLSKLCGHELIICSAG